jgi:hypothetical protein
MNINFEIFCKIFHIFNMIGITKKNSYNFFFLIVILINKKVNALFKCNFGYFYNNNAIISVILVKFYCNNAINCNAFWCNNFRALVINIKVRY